MSDNGSRSDGFVGVLALGMIACCGLPLLLGAGIAISAAGLAFGSLAVLAAGIALAVWGWRRRQNSEHCDVPADEPLSARRDDISRR